ncbi:D-glycerate dehydrogenase [Candidatus Falkowbacteria bacterium]|nr:D-glycerate dehydrogenase [Candidatus Falkowbacteria bacterium]
MEKRKVFVTRSIPEAGLALLRQQKNVRLIVSPHDRVLTRAELLRGVKGADAILCLLTDKIDGAVMDSAGPQLKGIANYAVGFDNIDLAAAKKRGIWVSNTPGASTNAVAEHAVALLLALMHRLPEADRFVRAGKYKGWAPMLLTGSELPGRTLGIVGVGRIGSALAHRLADGFGLRVVYSDVIRNIQLEKQFKAKRLSLRQLLRQADVVSLHVPLLPSTRHLIGAKELKLMKPTAYLINTSRGPVVDEKALVTALRHQTIAGAGLDVYEFEPKLAPGLAKLNNVILTPHIASATLEARTAMAIMAAKNIIHIIAGKRPPHLAQ